MAGAERGVVRQQLERVFGSGSVAGLSDAELLQRFVVSRDEAAFAALVARHGPMVLAVCRGVLRCPHDAEDAFQAAFLILARKSRTLEVRETIGGWLHKVAHRVAVEANKVNARRTASENHAAALNPPVREVDESARDRALLLHEEIGRLPERYRAPIVLCDLESMTREQAAGQLGWPPGTVAGRLARARDLLRTRLARRGVAPTVAAAGAILGADDASAAVPASWARATTTAALRYGKGGAAAGGSVSIATEVLIQEVTRAMMRIELRRVLTITLVCGSAFVAMVAALASADQKAASNSVAVTGVVVDPEGKPLAGAKVFNAPFSASGPWGKVDRESRTEHDGTFRLELATDAEGRQQIKPGVIWAYQPGKLLASYRVQPETAYPNLPLRLVIAPPVQSTFEIRDPEGKPVAGARIKPRVIHRDYWSIPSVPDGLADLIEAETVTDANGRAVMTSLLPEELGTIFVTAKGFGSQQFGVENKRHKPDPSFRATGKGEIPRRIITLLPVGRVTGRLVGEPAAIRGRTVLVGTNDHEHPSPYPGLVYAKTDDEGRFSVAEVSAGNLGVYIVDRNPASPWHDQQKWSGAVKPGETTDVELSLEKAVRIHGIVRERDTLRPVKGAKIGLGLQVEQKLTTDAEGRFEGYTPPGDLHIGLNVPEGYAWLLYGVPNITVPENTVEFELPPIDLTPAGEIRGLVVDEKNGPVAGAVVEASWSVDEGANRHGRRELQFRSDGRGEFRLRRVPVATEVLLSAHKLGSRTSELVATRVGAAGPATLRLDPSHAVALSGRVVDGEGRPIPGAKVRIRELVRVTSRQIMDDRVIEFENGSILITDAKGRYHTPQELDRDGEYAAFASVEGLRVGWTAWVPGASGNLSDLVLRPETAPADDKSDTP